MQFVTLHGILYPEILAQKIINYYFFSVLRIESEASRTLVECFVTELHF